MKIIDISVTVSDSTPLWPRTPRLKLNAHASMRHGDEANDTNIQINLHTGTHLDAPLHFVKQGKSIDRIPLDVFIGPVFVAYLPKIKKITADVLTSLSIPRSTTRILFKTDNSKRWRAKSPRFTKNYVGLDESGARWLATRGIKLVGVDYLSVAAFDEAGPVHRVLLKKNIVLLEGINLSGVASGRYQLICLPIKFKKTEAAFTRAVLVDK